MPSPSQKRNTEIAAAAISAVAASPTLAASPSVIAAADAAEIRAAANRIRACRSRAAKDIIEIGRDLRLVKSRIGHGNFLPWLKAEFAMSADTAERYINVAEKLGDQIPHAAEFETTVLYALAAPSTSPEVRAEAITLATNGEKVTTKVVADLKAKHSGCAVVAERAQQKIRYDRKPRIGTVTAPTSTAVVVADATARVPVRSADTGIIADLKQKLRDEKAKYAGCVERLQREAKENIAWRMVAFKALQNFEANPERATAELFYNLKSMVNNKFAEPDDGQIDPAALSVTAQQKLEAVIRQHQHKLDSEHAARMRGLNQEINHRVIAATKEKIAKLDAAEAEAWETEERFRGMINNHKKPFTLDQFKTIVMCLHPDGQRTIEKMSEAFRLFNDRKLQLTGAK